MQESSITAIDEQPTNIFTAPFEQPANTLEIRCNILYVLNHNISADISAGDLLNVTDLCTILNMPRSTINYHIQKLKSSGFLLNNLKKTKYYRSYHMRNGNVYVPSVKGLDFLANNTMDIVGHPFRTGETLTEGPSPPLTLSNLHGDLFYRFTITHFPDETDIEWDNVSELNNGVKRYVKRFGNSNHPEGHRATAEIYRGKKNITMTLKPRVTAGPTPNDLIKQCDIFSWYAYRYFTLRGFEIKLPERHGQGKFTLVSPQLEEVHTEYAYTDRSEGRLELHPTLGSLEKNAKFSRILTEAGYLVELTENHEAMRDRVADINDSLIELNKKYESLLNNFVTLVENVSKISKLMADEYRGDETLLPTPAPDTFYS